jgi:hypothetical protein
MNIMIIMHDHDGCSNLADSNAHYMAEQWRQTLHALYSGWKVGFDMTSVSTIFVCF